MNNNVILKGQIMNPEHIKNLIEQVLNKRQGASTNVFHLVIYKGTLKVIGTHNNVKPELFVASMTELTIVNGFTSKQWNSMADKIADYCEKESKCLQNLKP